MNTKNPNPAPSVIKIRDEITDTELDKATGGTKAGSGKVTFQDIHFTKAVDKASPNLF